MIYTVTFNPSLDYVMFVPVLLVGGVSRAREERIFPGGKGINVAVVLERLGQPCTALGFIAGYTGRAMLAILETELEHIHFISLPNGQNRINVKVKSIQESDINGAGPLIGAKELGLLWEQIAQLQVGDILVLAGAVAPGIPNDIYADFLKFLQPRGVLCVVDAVGPLLQKTLPYHPFLIKPNQSELADLLGQSIQTEQQLSDAARQVQQMGARNVLVSLGADGALLLDETGKEHRMAAVSLPRPVVNSVGAGDSMVAGFLTGWITTHQYEQSLKWGLASGAACVMKEWLPEKTDIVNLLATTAQTVGE